MRVVNLKEMKKIEKTAVEQYGFEERLIIENVGFKGAEVIEEVFLKERSYGEIVVLVGRGNNGADGMAIARHLKNRGYSIRAFMLFPGEAADELKKQYTMAKAYGVKISDVKGVEQISAYFTQTQDQYLVIDGVFGTGVRLPLSSDLFDIFSVINTHASVIIAVDIPSGIVGDTGEVSSIALKSDCTLAIGLPKIGHYMASGVRYCGEILVLDVGFPQELLEGGEKHLLTPDSVADLFVERDKFAHKKSFGHTLVIGGSQGLTGALLMASTAALKVGTGLVTAVTWKENYTDLASRVMPEIMTGIIPTKDDDMESILRYLQKFDAIVLGPGLGQGDLARQVVLSVLNNYSGPIVVDADAINVLSLKKDRDIFARRKGLTILTPHMREFVRFIGTPMESVLSRPIDYLKDLIHQTNSCLILKGPCTYMGFPDGQIFINYYPNDGMASGGTGDVLAGILGGLLAQNSPEKKQSGHFAENSAYFHGLCLGLMAHTLAGKHAAKNLGVRAMTAGSIIDHLSHAFLEMRSIKKGALQEIL